MADSSQNRVKNIIIALLVLAVVIVGYLLTRSSGEVKDLEAEKQSLIVELEGMRSQLTAMQSDNDSMAVFITAESERLNMMIEELKQDKDFNQKKYEEYRAKTNQLKKQNDRLVAKVDSVNKAYQALQIEKQAVEENLEGEVVKNAELTDENTVLKKDVAVGSMLQLSKLNSAAYKVKGGGKETETNKASGATRIKACFTVAKNMIATKGERTVYMRVTTPDLKVIAAKGEANNTFSFNGQPLMFSAKQALFYEQDIIESCINLDKETDFVAGEYTVELYTEGYKLGETKVILK
jgi:predicted nuclease with TOPRIM domain